MRSASTITDWRRIGIVLIINVLLVFQASGQENSPYSRYGFGDVIPTQNVVNRAMGGMSLAYYDLQSVNFTNPATYARLKLTTFDVGLEYDSRTIRSETSLTNSFTSRYLIPTYVNIGFPLSRKKSWGMVLGMKPVTRINYSISKDTRLPGIDSARYIYDGTGGSYQFFTGLAYGTKKLSIGVNAGYMWGNKTYSTRLGFLNDTVRYQKANYTDSTFFGGLFVKAGLQYQVVLSGDMNLRFGGTYSMQSTMNAKRDITRQTFETGTNGLIVVDSVYRAHAVKGEIIYPASWGGGILLEKIDHYQFGVEYNATQWDNYRYYGEKDALRSNWTLRVGGQMIPDINSKSYWSRVSYRVGFYLGPDYVDLGSKLNTWSFTFGTGLPVRRNYYTNQYTTINTAFEIGARGNKSNPVRESLFRLSVGFNLSDIWFNKRQYQ